MAAPRLPGFSAGLGLLIGVMILVVASLWFVGEAIQTSRQEAEVRKATVAAMGLAAVVGQVEAVGGDTAAVAAAVDRYRQGDPQIAEFRLVKQSGAQLVQSSYAADIAAGALPRRLVREEKPLFDLTQELRANVETNRAEGVYRLIEIKIESAGVKRLRVTAPVYGVNGAYWGVAQIERIGTAPETGADRSLATWLGLAALILFVLGILALNGLVEPGDERRPWLEFALAAILMIAVAGFYSRAELTKVAAYERARSAELGVVYNSLVQSAGAALADRATMLTDVHAWDVDSYRRPKGVVDADGTLNFEKLQAAVQAHTRSVERSLWWTVGITLAVLAFFAFGKAAQLWQTLRSHREAYYYVAPALLGMLLLVFFPFTYGIVLSFTDRTLFNQSVPLSELLVGFENYIKILSDFDVMRWTPEGWVVNYESFYWTLFITICWTVVNVVIGVTLGLLLALALNVDGLRGKAVYRVLLILPWAIPNYITALTWKGMFHPQFGVINQVIVMFGGEPVFWFDSVFTSFLTGVITNGWLSFPFMMVVALGALQSIPTDMYEAAELDGASKWQQFWNITLPLLKPALIPAIILSIVWTFNMFNVIYLVSGGSPAGANEILITKAYKLAFERYQYAYAAAYSFVIFLILLAYGSFQNRVSKATEQVR
jgi:arabinogalactan oligomer / maltooligosaccharide transport system permease protein